jgi:hypothetical protein
LLRADIVRSDVHQLESLLEAAEDLDAEIGPCRMHPALNRLGVDYHQRDVGRVGRQCQRVQGGDGHLLSPAFRAPFFVGQERCSL